MGFSLRLLLCCVSCSASDMHARIQRYTALSIKLLSILSWSGSEKKAREFPLDFNFSCGEKRNFISSSQHFSLNFPFSLHCWLRRTKNIYVKFADSLMYGSCYNINFSFLFFFSTFTFTGPSRES